MVAERSIVSKSRAGWLVPIGIRVPSRQTTVSPSSEAS
jgi:hypothetical protein